MKTLHRRVSDAEVMTAAIAAALFSGGNFQHALNLMNSPLYIPDMPGRSRFSRRLHAVHDLFLLLFSSPAEIFKELNSGSSYIIDSFPVPVCDSIRIRRPEILRGESYRGCTASERRYFYGVKIHLMITSQGGPAEFFFYYAVGCRCARTQDVQFQSARRKHCLRRQRIHRLSV